MTLSRSTKLNAINAMLTSIGGSPVNSLTDDSNMDLVTAIAILDETSRAVQSEDWHFNRVPQRVFNPDSSGNINIPSNVVRVSSYYDYNDVVQRGSLLYNRAKDTFNFDSSITLVVVELLEWEDLPEQARNYIFIRAARVLHDRTHGSTDQHRYSRESEAMARHELERSDIRNGKYGVLNDSNSVATRWRPGYTPIF